MLMCEIELNETLSILEVRLLWAMYNLTKNPWIHNSYVRIEYALHL